MLKNPEATLARNTKRAQRLQGQLVHTTILGRFRKPPPLMVFVALALSSIAVLISSDTSGGQILTAVLLFGLISAFVTLVPQGVNFAVTSIAVIAILKAAQPDSPTIHLVPMLVIFSAGSIQVVAEDRRLPRPSVIFAGIVSFFLSILFTNVVLSPDSAGGGASGSNNQADSGSGGEPGLLERFVRWVGEMFGSDGGDPAEGSRAARPQEPFDWSRLLIALGILIIIAGLGYLMWRMLRRFGGPGSGGLGGRSSDLVRRFEKVGSDAGMTRSPSVGLMSYGQELSSTGDERPLNTGGLVSAAIYDPGQQISDLANAAVLDLESSPLPPVVAPARSRRTTAWWSGRRKS